MSEPLTTLPGDIPGLLRRGSPVLWTEAMIPGVVVALVAEELGSYSDPPILSVALFGQHVLPDRCIDVDAHDRRHLVLDLTDATGRAHAAWWVVARIGEPGADSNVWFQARRMCDLAEMNRTMTPAQVDVLCCLCLRLAGRSHV